MEGFLNLYFFHLNTEVSYLYSIWSNGFTCLRQRRSLAFFLHLWTRTIPQIRFQTLLETLSRLTSLRALWTLICPRVAELGELKTRKKDIWTSSDTLSYAGLNHSFLGFTRNGFSLFSAIKPCRYNRLICLPELDASYLTSKVPTPIFLRHVEWVLGNVKEKKIDARCLIQALGLFGKSYLSRL